MIDDRKPGRYLPKKRPAFVAIRKFMCDGDVKLHVEEEAILNRWIYCDALLREKEKNEEQIIDDLVQKFTISPFTARQDITNTQRLFADARKINKKYLIHHHLQRIDEDIQRLRKAFFQDRKGLKSVPDAKELSAYAKLMEAYTYTLNSIPEEIQVDKQPPPIFQFILAPGQVIEKPMQIEDAMQKADEILLKQNPEGVYEMQEEEENESS